MMSLEEVFEFDQQAKSNRTCKLEFCTTIKIQIFVQKSCGSLVPFAKILKTRRGVDNILCCAIVAQGQKYNTGNFNITGNTVITRLLQKSVLICFQNILF